MDPNTQRPCRILFALLLVIMTLPGVLMFVPATRGKPLFGIPPIPDKERTPVMLYLGSHDRDEMLVKQSVGGCNHAVRLYNELNYRLFKYSSAPKLIIGQDDYFYENIYIDEYQGKDFVGEAIVRDNLLKFKRLQDSLHSHGIEFLLVLEPGKARCMPEYLPRRCRKGAQTNYDSYTRIAKELGVRMLDLNAYFQSIVVSEPYPLYSRHGIHWTTYGMWHAADTLQRFIERECQITMPSFRHVFDTLSTVNKDLDFDLEPPMNLLSELPHEKLCFPVMEPQPVTGSRPRALVIADSYVWSLWNHGILKQWFDQPEFWYYNLTIYPHIWDPTAYYVDKRTLPEVLRQKDVILLMTTDANLRNFGWHCLEEIQESINTHKNAIFAASN
ncbi:MAG: hypothetical protein J5730_07670 [Bacteroidales bacterium]|nr:hypothetical protein [Bacteroidales bacterium]